MATQKQGDLRLLKNGVIFGPTDRAGLEGLLAAGRVGPDDKVSVQNADWVRIADYLSAPAAPPSKNRPAPRTSAPAPAQKKGELRVLSGGRIVSALTREGVESLKRAGRVGDDDLICAVSGPWMSVGDFFAPPPPETPPVPAKPASTSPASPLPSPTPLPAPAPLPSPIPLSGRNAAPRPPLTPIPLGRKPGAAASQTAPDRAAPPQPPGAAPMPVSPGYSLANELAPRVRRGDEWFVRVRGIHSSPLRPHHVKALYQAREVTLDDVARHPSWPENDWRPLRSIPELAEITRP